MSFADKNKRAPKIRPQSIDQVLTRLDRVEAGHLLAMLSDEATWPSADVVDALHDEGYRVSKESVRTWRRTNVAR